jgi:CRP-like cAMP-binding protein
MPQQLFGSQRGGKDMYVQQANFFFGTSMTFANEIMKTAVRESHPTGTVIFKEGEVADHFYVLLEGRVRISIGESGHVVYIVSSGGEAFGWSSLVGRERYTASAECVEPTALMSFERERFQQVLAKDPVNGMTLYKGLANTLAGRLLETYRMISGLSLSEKTIASGSGQFMSADPAR